MFNSLFLDPHRSYFLARHVFVSNDVFRDVSCRGKYHVMADHKKLIPTFLVPLNDLNKYSMNVSPCLRGLGWDSLLRLPRDPPNTLVYPDAVFQFYANLRVENSVPPRCFSTYVDGYLILMTLEMLHLVLGLPNEGLTLASEEDFPLFGFEPITAINTLTNNPGGDQWPVDTSQHLPTA
ncbi:hypothetical protein LINPERHAP2_LOCUS2883 [Linum perenne]